MFKYLALSWTVGDQAAQHVAGQLGLQIAAHSEWETVLSRPGLSVFTSGGSPTNAAYVLPPNAGVVLGKLFRRSESESSSTGSLAFRGNEARRIVQTGGRSLVDEFWGRYVALLSDEDGAGVRVLRDPSGGLPCFFVRYRTVWIVFSWLEDVLSFIPSAVRSAINWDYVAVQVPSFFVESRETALENVSQVIAGEAVTLTAGREKRELYWNLAEVARGRIDESRAESAFLLRKTVKHCVGSWASSHGALMLRLSGGVDSSIVASCLSLDSTQASVTCINYHSAGSDSDERLYARLAARKAKRELIECERDPRFPLESILSVARTPKPWYYLEFLDTGRRDAELARSYGASAVYSGAGGDQLFLQYSRCWPAADYLRVKGLDAGFPRAAMDAARLGRESVWRTVWLAALERLRLHPARHSTEVGKHMAMANPEVVASARRDRRFMHPALVSIDDLPIGKSTQVRHLTYALEYYDPFNFKTCPEPVHPLLSQPVMELCLRLPTYTLTYGGQGRALARQAFAGELPPEIARRRSKGGMEEHLNAVLLRHRDFLRNVLLDGVLVGKGMLDRKKLEQVLSGRPTTVASPLVEIALYLSLEAWLNRWLTSERRAEAA